MLDYQPRMFENPRDCHVGLRPPRNDVLFLQSAVKDIIELGDGGAVGFQDGPDGVFLTGVEMDGDIGAAQRASGARCAEDRAFSPFQHLLFSVIISFFCMKSRNGQRKAFADHFLNHAAYSTVIARPIGPWQSPGTGCEYERSTRRLPRRFAPRNDGGSRELVLLL